MWPKALTQLLELAPHVTRLVPVADRYLQSRAENRDAARRAMEQMSAGLRGEMAQMAEGLRGDMGQMASAQAGIYHQMNEQAATLSRIAADVRSTRLSTDEMEARMMRIEARISRMWMTFFAGLILLVFTAAGVLAVLAVIHLHQFVHGS